MKKIKWASIFYFIMTIVLFSSTLFAQTKSPLTTAETSNYTATSTYEEVMIFIDDILAQSSHIRKEIIT